MGFMDDLNDMFNKGAAAAGDVLNKGASAAGRMADSANLRFKQGEIDRRWKDACAELGESLIDVVKSKPKLMNGREQMMANIDAIAAERAQVAAELERIAQEAEKARQSVQQRVCPECGGTVAADANFCMHCGHPMPIEVKPEPQPEPITAEPAPEASQSEKPADEKKPQ